MPQALACGISLLLLAGAAQAKLDWLAARAVGGPALADHRLEPVAQLLTLIGMEAAPVAQGRHILAFDAHSRDATIAKALSFD